MNFFKFLEPNIGEDFTTLLKHKNININRIVSSSNFKSTKYIQDEDEWLVVIEGNVTLMIDDKEKNLCKGDTLFIPSRTPHTVTYISQGTIWLTVHIY